MKNKRKWSLKDQALLLKRLSDLLEKGYTLNEALNFISVNEKGRQKDDLLNCVSNLAEGYSLRYGLTNLYFHRDVLSYLYFAEQHGNMEFALKESSIMLYKKIAHYDKLTKILRYPIFLIFTVAVILIFIQSVITPQFNHLYTSMNIEVSIFSMILSQSFLYLRWSMLIAAIFLLLFLIYYFIRFRKYTAERKMRLIVKIPILKTYVKMMLSYYLSLQISILLRGGMSIYDCLKIFTTQSIIPFFQEEANTFIHQLKAGQKFNDIIYEREFYEDELSQVILHGQANGQLARELYMYSQFVIEKIDTSINKIITYIQPTVYLFVGIIVLFVYLSMLMPMYKMIDSI
ncbi:competence type IV pilus assembly protein ComGB [Metabacillus malikii]|uniref:Competence protein ComGB n=1 Tax=Metabacillus malikii TaxID=1504265 RepID=A0ABT9ZJJ2_9BACI|nr:competence type IV pilus assembly protein ComGB [Metabacillus malikii]MDQ0231967.1 competence protein ComGB [Metabacillus malikii]